MCFLNALEWLNWQFFPQSNSRRNLIFDALIGVTIAVLVKSVTSLIFEFKAGISSPWTEDSVKFPVSFDNVILVDLGVLK
jgi:multisubunit Na+/H+ antiporter MnhB subunit